MKTETEKRSSPRVIPNVLLDGTAYFVDLGQRQFRETMNPASYVDFDSVKGQQFCREVGVVTCLGCGMSVIAPTVENLDDTRCMRCSRMTGEK